MPYLQIYLLGIPRFVLDGSEIILKRQKAKALLAYLSLNRKMQSRDTLANMLWPGKQDARTNLRREIYILRDALGGNIVQVDGENIGLNPKVQLWIDTDEFDVCFPNHDASQPNPERLIQCLELVRGSFMEGLRLPDCPAFEEWQFFKGQALKKDLLGLLDRLVAIYSQASDYPAALQYARLAASQDGFDEQRQARLIELYALNRETEAALHHYEQFTHLLEKELNAAPSEDLVSFVQSIKAGHFKDAYTDHVKTSFRKSSEPVNGERFELQNLIAEGSYGYVYLGLDHQTGENVVIKRMKLDLFSQDPQAMARFSQEGEALRRLNHPNIVSLIGFLDQDGQRSIVMEYVPGGSLAELLEKSVYLPIGRVLDISLELADALSRAHHLHILHRDLKPANVLLAEDGTPRLTDFGMARLERDNARLTPTGTVIGSPLYMPPEALRGDELDARSDIWSLGILIFEMLTGKPPFEGDRITVTITRILRDPLPDIQQLRPEIPPALNRLLKRMLAKEPNQRIASMRQVAAELEAIRSGGPIGEPLPVLPSEAAIEPASRVIQKIISILPSQLTPFIGRQEELAALEDLLTRPGVRLVTIVAMGGMGKTRLALATAEKLAEGASNAYQDGIIFVPLASVESLAALSTSLASGLQLSLTGEADPLDQISSYLHRRNMLIILDNFEQLAEKGVFFLEKILESAPRITLLITSRIPLRLSVEWRFDLLGLTYPNRPIRQKRSPTVSENEASLFPDSGSLDREDQIETYASIQLFIQTARQTGVDFQLSLENIQDVMGFCQRVAGMPLAIKLGAAWLRVMPIDKILLEIDRGLELFTSSMRDAPERQRSLLAVFESTWDLLTPAQMSAIEALSVFRGGFYAEAARIVAGASPLILAGLVDSGLLQLDWKEEDKSNPAPRYSIHELVRQFASSKLFRDPVTAGNVSEKHCRFYAQFIHDQEINLRQGDQSAEVIQEIDNLRAAWQYAVEKQLLDVLQQAHWGMAIFFWLQGWFTEAIETLSKAGESLQAHLPAETLEMKKARSLLIELFLNASAHSQFAGLLDQAERYLEEASAISEKTDRLELSAMVLDRRARLAQEQGNILSALEWGEAAHAAYEAIGDKTNAARMLSHLGAVNVFRQEYDLAFRQLDECLNLFYAHSFLTEIVIALSNLALACLNTGAFSMAKAHLEEANVLYNRMQIPAHTIVLNLEGIAAEIDGDYAQARIFYQESLNYCRNVGNKMREAIAGARLGNLCRLEGNLAEAELFLLQSLSVHRQIGRIRESANDQYFLAVLCYDRGDSSTAREHLDEATLLYEQGGDREGQAACLALYSRLAHAQGNADLALEQAQAGLQMALQVGAKPLAASVLVDLAVCLITRDETQKGLSLLYYCAQASEAHFDTRKQAKALLSVQKVYQNKELMDDARLEGGRISLERARSMVLNE